jgi:hypothetical protein
MALVEEVGHARPMGHIPSEERVQVRVDTSLTVAVLSPMLAEMALMALAAAVAVAVTEATTGRLAVAAAVELSSYVFVCVRTDLQFL